MECEIQRDTVYPVGNGVLVAVAWNRDGTKIASVGHDGFRWKVQLWNALQSANHPLLEFEHVSAYTVSVAFSPDAWGIRLATSNLSGHVQIWSTLSGKRLLTLSGHDQDVIAVAWHPDGIRLASASLDRTVRIWNATTGQLVRTLEGHTGAVYAVAWSPDGTRLASAGLDGTVRVWDPEQAEPRSTFRSPAGKVWMIAWSPDGTKIATANEVWDAITGTLLFPLERGYADGMGAVEWSPDGMKIATTNGRSQEADWGRLHADPKNTEVRIFKADNGKLRHRFEGSIGLQLALAWNPTSTQVASVGQDGSIHGWSLCDVSSPTPITTPAATAAPPVPQPTRLVPSATRDRAPTFQPPSATPAVKR